MAHEVRINSFPIVGVAGYGPTSRPPHLRERRSCAAAMDGRFRPSVAYFDFAAAVFRSVTWITVGRQFPLFSSALEYGPVEQQEVNMIDYIGTPADLKAAPVTSSIELNEAELSMVAGGAAGKVTFNRFP
jgi:hypothetical protein